MKQNINMDILKQVDENTEERIAQQYPADWNMERTFRRSIQKYYHEVEEKPTVVNSKKAILYSIIGTAACGLMVFCAAYICHIPSRQIPSIIIETSTTEIESETSTTTSETRTETITEAMTESKPIDSYQVIDATENTETSLANTTQVTDLIPSTTKSQATELPNEEQTKSTTFENSITTTVVEVTEIQSEPFSEPETEAMVETESVSETEVSEQGKMVIGDIIPENPIPGFRVQYGLQQDETIGWVITSIIQADDPQDFSIPYGVIDPRFEIRNIEIEERNNIPYRIFNIYDNQNAYEYQIVQMLRKDFRFDWWFKQGNLYRWFDGLPYSFVYGDETHNFYQRFWDDENYITFYVDQRAAIELNQETMSDHAIMMCFKPINDQLE